jgi:cell division protein ZapB
MPIVNILSKLLKNKAIPMTDTEEFEQKLDQLIATCQQLKRENASLREREAGLVGERGTLLEQNEMARKKIKDMIDRLRSLSAE